MKKNVLAFIQPTNAAPRAMFSWLNTNTSSIVEFIFSSIQINQHGHFISAFTAVFLTVHRFFSEGGKKSQHHFLGIYRMIKQDRTEIKNRMEKHS